MQFILRHGVITTNYMAQWLTIKHLRSLLLYYSAHKDSGLATSDIIRLIVVVALDVIRFAGL